MAFGIELSDIDNNNPIVVGIQHNPAMDRYEVVLVVGNFKTNDKAETAARHIVKLVERELGSRATKQTKLS